jgi:hypothetical protein
MTDQEHAAAYRRIKRQYDSGILTVVEYETALARLHYEWKRG